ncbi:hypothetical protein RVR_152 [Actinacidiphila reveromycinica]|uniref:Uncharacterized protein n=1 Tax=Actinacidiphila reveromycinica TaxID=659352 RepID=A0A7U3UMK4_9ACTN|nr:hypothetical protein RVR_152 [Streptomyces sp. SN-593]
MPPGATLRRRVEGVAMQIHHVLTTLAVNDSPGPGPVMRTFIVVSVVGAAFLGWFLLRGYRD